MSKRKAPEAAATPPTGRVVDPGPRATKRKVSVTLDESVLEEVRALAGDRPLSAAINDLLRKGLAQSRLTQLVDEMEAEAGPVPPEVYEQILDEWDRGVKR